MHAYKIASLFPLTISVIFLIWGRAAEWGMAMMILCQNKLCQAPPERRGGVLVESVWKLPMVVPAARNEPGPSLEGLELWIIDHGAKPRVFCSEHPQFKPDLA